jgi:hypothetical protein
MIGIPEATAIILTTAERAELEGLVRSKIANKTARASAPWRRPRVISG